MKKFAIIFPLILLAACGQAPEAQPVPSETVAAAPVKPSLPAPDQENFAAAFAKACPTADKVNISVCKRAGLGSTDVICEYGLGKDEYMRHNATLTPSEGVWTVADPKTTCAEHGAE